MREVMVVGRGTKEENDEEEACLDANPDPEGLRMFCRTQVGGLVVDFAADLSCMARVGRWVLIAVEGEEGEITWISVGDGFKE